MGYADVLYDLHHGAPRRVLNDTLRQFAVRIDPDDVVLEIGSGHYDHRPFFRKLVRVDLDGSQNPDVVADARLLPFGDASIDHSICLSVLEHVYDPYRIVAEWARVMRPGGRVLAWVPFFFGVHAFPDDVGRFTREGLVMLFERSGFDVQRADSAPYAGLFHNLSNAVHFVLPRSSRRRSVRTLNRVLFLAARSGFPLDRRFDLSLSRLYAGTELEAVRRDP